MPSFATRGSIFTVNGSVLVTPAAVRRALKLPGATSGPPPRTAAFHVAAAGRPAARVAKIPDETVHTDLRRQCRRQPAAAASAAASAVRRHGAALEKLRTTLPAASRISSFTSPEGLAR